MNVGLVHPDSQSLTPQILNQLDDILLVLPRVTDKNVRPHRGLFPFADLLHEIFVVWIIAVFVIEDRMRKVEMKMFAIGISLISHLDILINPFS